ncbi:outer membrane lipoprotein-sorting protein [Candidatus Margulisiibacteriota bacterium]
MKVYYKLFKTIFLLFLLTSAIHAGSKGRQPFETPYLQDLMCAALQTTARSPFAYTGEEIINKVDKNITFKNARFESEMVIHIGDEIRTKKLVSYSKGQDTGFAKFLYPPRDKGVKYLKIEDNLWMYLPSVEKVIKIAGHMLRQSMMGSDMSYEDALDNTKLKEKYTITLIGSEKIAVDYVKNNKVLSSKKDCYILDLVAKVKKVTYHRRKIWVDKQFFVPVREELFAKSGKKLKVLRAGNIKNYQGRYFATYSTMRNLLRKKSWTEFILKKAEFDIKLAKDIFSHRQLRK